MVRVALLSFWHVHAKDYAREALAHPRVELAAIWDEDPARGADEARQRNVAFAHDLDAILANPSIDAVIVTSSTAVHRPLIARAIAAGKHVFTEKVLGSTLREAIDLRDLAREADIALGVALSRTEIPEIAGIRSLIESGRLGKVTEARVRVAHGGAVPTRDQPGGWLPLRFLETGEAMGGAMIDLGAHPLYLTRLLLGMPSGVTAVYGHVTGRGGDDNAAAILSYPDGAIGVAETGFVSKTSPVSVEAHGFEASAISNAARQVIDICEQDDDGKRHWSSMPYDPTRPATPFERWIDAIEDETRPDTSLAIDLSALVEAANRSAATGARVQLDQLDGWAER